MKNQFLFFASFVFLTHSAYGVGFDLGLGGTEIGKKGGWTSSLQGKKAFFYVHPSGGKIKFTLTGFGKIEFESIQFDKNHSLIVDVKRMQMDAVGTRIIDLGPLRFILGLEVEPYIIGQIKKTISKNSNETTEAIDLILEPRFKSGVWNSVRNLIRIKVSQLSSRNVPEYGAIDPLILETGIDLMTDYLLDEVENVIKNPIPLAVSDDQSLMFKEGINLILLNCKTADWTCFVEVPSVQYLIPSAE